MQTTPNGFIQTCRTRQRGRRREAGDERSHRSAVGGAFVRPLARHVGALAPRPARRPRARLPAAGPVLHPHRRPRRGPLRPGLAADGGERRLCGAAPRRGHPLQEADRHLLAAGRRGEAHRPRRDGADLGVPPALAVRRAARGAGHLCGGTAHVRRGSGLPRRRAHRHLADPRGRSQARQDRRGAARRRRDRPMGAGARLSRSRRRAAEPRLGAAVLGRHGGRHPHQGADRADAGGAHGRHALPVGPQGDLAEAAASGAGRALHAGVGAALADRHHGALRHRLLSGIGRPRPARQGRDRAGNARIAAWRAFRRLLVRLLARRGAGRRCGAVGLGQPRGAGGALLPRLADPVLDRLRADRHQAAALYPAGLSRRWRCSRQRR